MNKNILGLANVILIGFVVLVGFLAYWQIVRAGTLTDDPALNRTRLLQNQSTIKRGAILDRNGIPLASNVRAEGDWRRVYSMPSLVHVVGYHSARFGNSGVEAYSDDYLNALKGVSAIKMFQNRVLHRPTEGNDVVLTVDTVLQKVADDALGSDAGAVIAINPHTGEILAMASHPFFDPNTMERDWERLRDNPGKPLFNRATQGLYTPGSTFKTVTLTGALETGVTNPNEVFSYEMKTNDRGEYYHDQLVGGFRVYCANHGPTDGNRADLDLAHAYAQSCNVAFADLGLRLGPRQLADTATRFGFGAEIPIELPETPSRLGSDSGGIAKGDPATASTAFGQGELAVSPLQMALVAAAVANRGSILIPHVIQSVVGQDGEVLRVKPQEWRRAMSPQTAQTLTAMMLTSAEEGWAKTGRIPGVKVAAKTGTAETGSEQGSHAWFIAFAPVENPVIAVAVIKEFAGGGAAEAGPIARRVMQAALGLSVTH